MHRYLKAEAIKPPSTNMSAQPRRFERWRRTYNHERPHEPLDQSTNPSRVPPPVRGASIRMINRWSTRPTKKSKSCPAPASSPTKVATTSWATYFPGNASDYAVTTTGKPRYTSPTFTSVISPTPPPVDATRPPAYIAPHRTAPTSIRLGRFQRLTRLPKLFVYLPNPPNPSSLSPQLIVSPISPDSLLAITASNPLTSISAKRSQMQSSQVHADA
jgi:hypothetical protein